MEWWHRQILTLTSLFLLLGSPLAEVFADPGESMSACTESGCHGDRAQAMLSQSFVHSSWAPESPDDLCFGCHVDSEEYRQVQGCSGQVRSTKLTRTHEVTIRDLYPQTDYRLEVRSRDAAGLFRKLTLVYRAPAFDRVGNPGTQNERPTDSEAPPDRDSARELEDPEEDPPVIKNLHLGSLERRGFLYAEIVWDTNEPAEARVTWWAEGERDRLTRGKSELSRAHRIKLGPLKENARYYYKARSTDRWGNESVSEERSFSTEPPKSSRSIGTNNSLPLFGRAFAQSGGEVQITDLAATPGSVEGEIQISWKTANPADSVVSYRALDTEQCRPGAHPPLLPLDTVSVDQCTGCHGSNSLGLTHPVNVRIRRNSSDINKLPLNSSEEVTCATCHELHGSKEPYLVRRTEEEQICGVCHEPGKF